MPETYEDLGSEARETRGTAETTSSRLYCDPSSDDIEDDSKLQKNAASYEELRSQANSIDGTPR